MKGEKTGYLFPSGKKTKLPVRQVQPGTPESLNRCRNTQADLRDLMRQAPEHQPGIGNEHEEFLIGNPAYDDGTPGLLKDDLQKTPHAECVPVQGKKPYRVEAKCAERLNIQRIFLDIFDHKTIVRDQCNGSYAINLQELAQDLLKYYISPGKLESSGQ